jgi:uncharacterized coiled-coil protein SlyX
MAQTNAEKQELYRARQRQTMSDQAAVIAAQQKTISDLQAQLTKATSQVQKLTEEKHALEIKYLKLQAKKA